MMLNSTFKLLLIYTLSKWVKSANSDQEETLINIFPTDSLMVYFPDCLNLDFDHIVFRIQGEALQYDATCNINETIMFLLLYHI